MSELAILGGDPVRVDPWVVGPMVDSEEERLVLDAIRDHNFSRYIGSGGEEIEAELRMSSKDAGRIDAAWHFLGGPNVRLFAAEFADHFEVPYAIPINGATSGLSVALGALGLEPGDEVILPAISFSATAMAPLLFGGVPVFADVDPDTFCMDPDAVERLVSERTKAILVVHLAGNLADMDRLVAIAEKHGLAVVEDTAQAIGARWGDRYAGTIGHAGVYSFQQSKNITTGEGGMIVTSDPEVARRCRLIANHGENLMTEHHDDSSLVNIVGMNLRLPELCAALGRAQLRKLQTVNRLRTKNADLLYRGLSDLPGLRLPESQRSKGVGQDVPHMFVARYVEAEMGIPRSLFVSALKEEGIPVGTGYTRSLYANPNIKKRVAFGSKGYPWRLNGYESTVNYEDGACPVAEKLLNEEFLWFYHIAHPSTAEDMEAVIQAVRKVVENRTELQQAEHRLSNQLAPKSQGRL